MGAGHSQPTAITLYVDHVPGLTIRGGGRIERREDAADQPGEDESTRSGFHAA